VHKQLLSNHSFLIFITASSLLLAACTQTDTVESSLQDIQSILTAGNTDNEVHYQLSYDADFPCNAQLQENWKDDDRRAIIYSGYKISAGGTKKTFSEKRINNIRYRASLSDEDQQLVIKSMNTAIALCEEKYSFK